MLTALRYALMDITAMLRMRALPMDTMARSGLAKEYLSERDRGITVAIATMDPATGIAEPMNIVASMDTAMVMAMDEVVTVDMSDEVDTTADTIATTITTATSTDVDTVGAFMVVVTAIGDSFQLIRSQAERSPSRWAFCFGPMAERCPGIETPRSQD